MQWQRADSAVHVQVAAENPAHHVQVVDAHTLLQQVVALLIVHLEDVLTLPQNTSSESETCRVPTKTTTVPVTTLWQYDVRFKDRSHF